MFNDFKKFAVKGNAIDMAVGIVIGAAFSTIVKTLVDHVIMPPFGLLLGGLDFSNLFILIKEGSPVGPYGTLDLAKNAGAITVNYGLFVNSLVSFTIVAFALFLLVKGINKLKSEEAPKPAEPTTKDCPHCLSAVPIKANKCAYCTSELTT